MSINKTEGCHVYLSKESLNCEIVSAKSSEMNILVPQGDDDYVSDLIIIFFFHFLSLHLFTSLACLERNEDSDWILISHELI